MPRVVLGVTGGIAAYKAVELLRRLTESGHEVRVVPTAAALQFVGAPTWAALSGQPVTASTWDDVHEVPHVRIGQAADLVVVAPATADLLARAAHGLADDLLTSTRPPGPTSRCCVNAASSSSSRRAGGSPGPTPARAACPTRTSCSVSAPPSWPAGPRRPTSRVAAWSSRPAAPVSTSTPSGTWATARAAGKGTHSRAQPWHGGQRWCW